MLRQKQRNSWRKFLATQCYGVSVFAFKSGFTGIVWASAAEIIVGMNSKKEPALSRVALRFVWSVWIIIGHHYTLVERLAHSPPGRGTKHIPPPPREGNEAYSPPGRRTQEFPVAVYFGLRKKKRLAHVQGSKGGEAFRIIASESSLGLKLGRTKPNRNIHFAFGYEENWIGIPTTVRKTPVRSQECECQQCEETTVRMRQKCEGQVCEGQECECDFSAIGQNSEVIQIERSHRSFCLQDGVFFFSLFLSRVIRQGSDKGRVTEPNRSSKNSPWKSIRITLQTVLVLAASAFRMEFFFLSFSLSLSLSLFLSRVIR